MRFDDDQKKELRRRLLDRLRPLATLPGRPRKDCGVHMYGRQIFSYCCFTTERLAQVTIARPLIGMVLSGEKEFWLGDSGQRFKVQRTTDLQTWTDVADSTLVTDSTEMTLSGEAARGFFRTVNSQ